MPRLTQPSTDVSQGATEVLSQQDKKSVAKSCLAQLQKQYPSFTAEELQETVGCITQSESSVWVVGKIEKPHAVAVSSVDSQRSWLLTIDFLSPTGGTAAIRTLLGAIRARATNNEFTHILASAHSKPCREQKEDVTEASLWTTWTDMDYQLVPSLMPKRKSCLWSKMKDGRYQIIGAPMILMINRESATRKGGAPKSNPKRKRPISKIRRQTERQTAIMVMDRESDLSSSVATSEMSHTLGASSTSSNTSSDHSQEEYSDIDSSTDSSSYTSSHSADEDSSGSE